jgi:hypothetical protein
MYYVRVPLAVQGEDFCLVETEALFRISHSPPCRRSSSSPDIKFPRQNLSLKRNPPVSRTMDQLPLELINNTLRHLDTLDLKSSRLVDRRFCSQATPCLFQQILLYACPKSFQKLRAISDNAEFRGYVRKITYDTRLLPSSKGERNWSSWVSEVKEMTRWETNWRDPSYQPYQSTLESYRKYEEKHYASLIKGGDDLEPLKHAFRKLPSLRAIELCHGHDYEELVAKTFFSQGIEEFGPYYRRTYTIPRSEGGHVLLTPKAQSLLTASTLSTHPIQSMTLDVQHEFLLGSEYHKTALQAAQNLTKLSLRIFMPRRRLFVPRPSWGIRRRCSNSLADFIGSSKKLKSLRLAFRFVGEGVERLRKTHNPDAKDIRAITDELILRSADVFRNLQSFALDEGRATVEQLLVLLSSFKRLQYLELRGIMLEEGSWVTLLREFPWKLKVDRFALRGTISSLREQWITQVEHDAKSDRRTLRRRLERYVESGGSNEFPLFPGYHPRCYFHHHPSPSRMVLFNKESRYRMRKDDLSFQWEDELHREHYPVKPCTEACPMFSMGHGSGSDEDDLAFAEAMGIGTELGDSALPAFCFPLDGTPY